MDAVEIKIIAHVCQTEVKGIILYPKIYRDVSYTVKTDRELWTVSASHLC
jgi:hypothetical protein